jgi:carbon monoxide dehydrogenase subunit G
MSMDSEEQLELRAPVERVWKFLIDPEQVVTCLPGAELTRSRTRAPSSGR